MSQHIPPGSDDVALVDDDEMSSSPGTMGSCPGLAMRRVSRPRIVEYMRRFITQSPARHRVDRINGDTLDNRRSNLRIVTHQQNSQNRRLSSLSSTRHKGVAQGRLQVPRPHPAPGHPLPSGLLRVARERGSGIRRCRQDAIWPSERALTAHAEACARSNRLHVVEPFGGSEAQRLGPLSALRVRLLEWHAAVLEKPACSGRITGDRS